MTAIDDVSPLSITDPDVTNIDVSATADALMSVLAMLVETDPRVKDGEGQEIGASLGMSIGQRIEAARTAYRTMGVRAWHASEITFNWLVRALPQSPHMPPKATESPEPDRLKRVGRPGRLPVAFPSGPQHSAPPARPHSRRGSE